MNKLLLNGRKLVLIGRKLALATASCIALCCGGSGQLYYLLKLCGTIVPPGVPQYIAVPAPFACGGCPLNTDRIVIYRGHCYIALGLSPPACVPEACADGKCEASKLTRDQLGSDTLIVTAGDLLCKPLDTTCHTVPCVPVQPGCCSSPLRSPYCGDGSTQIECPMPKRFRISRSGNYHVISRFYADFGGCTGPGVCEDVQLIFSIVAEFQCIEGAGRISRATCRSLTGHVRYTGFSTGRDIPQADHDFIFTDEGSYARAVSEITSYIDNLPQPFGGYANCGGDHVSTIGDEPPSCRTHTETCEGGRYIVSDTINCASPLNLNTITISSTLYQDCWQRIYNYAGTGSHHTNCTANMWNDNGFDQTLISAVVACPTDAAGVDPGNPITDGRIFPLAGGKMRFPVLSSPVQRMGGELY